MDKYGLNTPNGVYDEQTKTYIQIKTLAVGNNLVTGTQQITGTLPPDSNVTVEQAVATLTIVFDIPPQQVFITKET